MKKYKSAFTHLVVAISFTSLSLNSHSGTIFDPLTMSPLIQCQLEMGSTDPNPEAITANYVQAGSLEKNTLKSLNWVAGKSKSHAVTNMIKQFNAPENVQSVDATASRNSSNKVSKLATDDFDILSFPHSGKLGQISYRTSFFNNNGERLGEEMFTAEFDFLQSGNMSSAKNVELETRLINRPEDLWTRMLKAVIVEANSSPDSLPMFAIKEAISKRLQSMIDRNNSADSDNRKLADAKKEFRDRLGYYAHNSKFKLDNGEFEIGNAEMSTIQLTPEERQLPDTDLALNLVQFRASWNPIVFLKDGREIGSAHAEAIITINYSNARGRPPISVQFTKASAIIFGKSDD